MKDLLALDDDYIPGVATGDAEGDAIGVPATSPSGVPS
jgi:hypothetical protein